MNTVSTAYATAPGTIGPLLAVVAVMYAVALAVLLVRRWPTVVARTLPALVLVSALVLTATPAEAARRHANGCLKGSTVGRFQTVYTNSIPLPGGERICFYESYRRIPLLGWWPTGTVRQWAR